VGFGVGACRGAGRVADRVGAVASLRFRGLGRAQAVLDERAFAGLGAGRGGEAAAVVIGCAGAFVEQGVDAPVRRAVGLHDAVDGESVCFLERLDAAEQLGVGLGRQAAAGVEAERAQGGSCSKNVVAVGGLVGGQGAGERNASNHGCGLLGCGGTKNPAAGADRGGGRADKQEPGGALRTHPSRSWRLTWR
jgi:hypothetical protein